jgi:hypothetical protein
MIEVIRAFDISMVIEFRADWCIGNYEPGSNLGWGFANHERS